MPISTCHETGKKNTKPDYYMFQKGSCHGSFKEVESSHHISPAMHPDNADKQKLAVTVTITTDNMEESVEAIEKAGGSVFM